MDFEEILANCLDALERGETIEGCLTRYPKHKAELHPLLRLAAAVRSVPQPRLSSTAFARGRTAVVTQARYQHARHRPFTKTRTKGWANLPQRHSLPDSQRALAPWLAQRPSTVKSFVFAHRATGAFISLVLLLCLITLARNISASLPGGLLYPAKILGEDMQGLLLTAAGEQAAWHAQQTENRLQELVVLTQQGQTASPELLKTIEANVQATLAASKTMPIVQRNQFLTDWVDHLQTLEKNQSLPGLATFALDKAIATVTTGTQVTVAPTAPPLPAPASAAPTPPLAISPAIILVPTRMPATATPLLVKAAPRPVEATPTQSIAAEANPALQFPTHAPAAPIVIETTPTAIPVVVQAPQETNPNNVEQSSDNHKHTARSQPEPTTEPTMVAVNPETANAAAKSDHQSNSAKSSNEMTKSIDAPPNAATPLSTSATTTGDAQATLTADTATPSTPTAGETSTAGTPTRFLTPVGDAVHPGDPHPSDPSTTPQSNNPEIATATSASPTTAATRATPTPTSKKTPESVKTSSPTAQPTAASSSPEAATPAAPTDATSEATADANSQTAPQSTATATDVNRKHKK